MENRYDFVIVGSGLFGATFNYLARQHGYSCIIVEIGVNNCNSTEKWPNKNIKNTTIYFIQFFL